jgi:hypothetical protein
VKIFLIVLFFVGSEADYPVVVKGLEPQQQDSMEACQSLLVTTEASLGAMRDKPAPYMVRCAAIETLMDLQRIVDDYRNGRNV